jgi:uncharacterized damage-inducible protein DinB
MTVSKELLLNETDLFVQWLDKQRAHAIEILDGLSDDDLRRPILQSGWSCLGMIGHLEGLERFWFRQVVLGDVAATSDIPREIEWRVDPTVSAGEVFDSYRSEIARANEIIRATPLDAPPVWWPDFFGEWRLSDLHEILLHTMTETAAHAGHLDAARELIDGRQWFVLEV